MSWAQRSRPARRSSGPAHQRPQRPPQPARRQAEAEAAGRPLREALPDLLVEAGHREEHRGPHPGQRRGQGVEVLQEVDVHRGGQEVRGVGAEDPLDHVVHRQEGEVARPAVIRAFQGSRETRVSAIQSTCPWRKVTPLGRAGGPGGEAQGGQVGRGPPAPGARRRRAAARGACRPRRLPRRPAAGTPPRAAPARPARPAGGRGRRRRPARCGCSSADAGQQRRGADQQQPGAGGFAGSPRSRRGAGVVEGHAHRAGQADRRCPAPGSGWSSAPPGPPGRPAAPPGRAGRRRPRPISRPAPPRRGGRSVPSAARSWTRTGRRRLCRRKSTCSWTVRPVRCRKPRRTA